MRHFDFGGRVALVTGAGSGIGRAVALGLEAEGAMVFCADVRKEAAEATANGHARMKAVEMDVAKQASVDAAMAQVKEAGASVDILVNSAGLLKQGRIADMGAEDWERIEQVNLGGVLRCTQAAMPDMMKKRLGRIINVASVSAFRGGGALGNTLYGASKAGVAALTMGLARELGPFGITVNAIAPAVTVTAMTAEHIDNQAEARILARIPLGRFATPDDSANAVLFLASDLAGFITGTVIPVDGGFLTT